MAKWLNMPVVAEGAERKEQVSFLHSIGCEYVQGFYFARPMPVKGYDKLLYEQPYLSLIHIYFYINTMVRKRLF